MKWESLYVYIEFNDNFYLEKVKDDEVNSLNKYIVSSN